MVTFAIVADLTASQDKLDYGVSFAMAVMTFLFSAGAAVAVCVMQSPGANKA